MIDGIYLVTFSSNSNIQFQGIAVLKGNSVNGGDHSYLYTGTRSGPEGKLNSILTIKQWSSSGQSVFGHVKEFVLNINGTYSSDKNFTAEGHRNDQPESKITIFGRYLSAVA